MFAGLAGNDPAQPLLSAKTTGFGQVIPTLLNEDDSVWHNKRSAFLWTQPQAISECFAQVIEMHSVDHEEALLEVDKFCDAVIAASHRLETLLLASWHLPVGQRGYGMLDSRPGLGVSSLLARMNLRLAERLNDTNGIYVLDSTRWFQVNKPYAPKMWYPAKVPFSNEVFKLAIEDVKAALRGVCGDARKIVVCDLDDTLWGGIVGDVGWENLRLGGHDPVGEAFVDLQRELKALTRRGVILAIVSKNTEEIALEAIEKHPEMVLRKADFAGWRINWKDKAQNIYDLIQELNLGLQAAVFLDDNPVERARVAEAFPEVLVPEMPKDKMFYAQVLRKLACFDTPALSHEDRSRALMYNTERGRREALQESKMVGSLDDWLHKLEVTVQVEPISESNRQRAAQLFNKTNQMNLQTRRMTESELVAWASGEKRKLWTFRVSDKFGDSGLTGIVSIELIGDDAYITDFILSCRVMGKRVEEAIVFQTTESARALGAKRLIANYQETNKNKPCLEFWQRSGFDAKEDQTFVWNLKQEYPKPKTIKFETGRSSFEF